MGTRAKRCKKCFAWEWEECECGEEDFHDYIETRDFTYTSAYV